LRVIDALETPQQGRTGMASSGKRKTTMAKLTRESRLRERRLDKQARKDARKFAAANPEAAANPADEPGHTLTGDDGASASSDAGQPSPDAVPQALTDA
jgi:hypothetical protein